MTDVSRSMISFCFGVATASIRLPPSPPRTAPAIASAADLIRCRIAAGSSSEASRNSVIWLCT